MTDERGGEHPPPIPSNQPIERYGDASVAPVTHPKPPDMTGRDAQGNPMDVLEWEQTRTFEIEPCEGDMKQNPILILNFGPWVHHVSFAHYLDETGSKLHVKVETNWRKDR